MEHIHISSTCLQEDIDSWSESEASAPEASAPLTKILDPQHPELEASGPDAWETFYDVGCHDVGCPEQPAPELPQRHCPGCRCPGAYPGAAKAAPAPGTATGAGSSQDSARAAPAPGAAGNFGAEPGAIDAGPHAAMLCGTGSAASAAQPENKFQ